MNAFTRFFQCPQKKKELENKMEQMRLDAQRIQTQYNKLVREYNAQNKSLQQRQKDKQELKDTLEATEDILQAKKEKLDHLRKKIYTKTEQRKYVENNYEKMAMPRYEDKRVVDGSQIPIFVDELIDPHAYLVQHFFSEAYNDTGTHSSFTQHVQRITEEEIAWTSDKTLTASGDRYLHPRETIARKKGDCEDISYVASSASPDQIFIAWGLLDGEGHAWNVTVINDTLWNMDSSSATATWNEENDEPRYEPHFIITKGQAYKVKDNPIRFGDLAQKIHD